MAKLIALYDSEKVLDPIIDRLNRAGLGDDVVDVFEGGDAGRRTKVAVAPVGLGAGTGIAGGAVLNYEFLGSMGEARELFETGLNDGGKVIVLKVERDEADEAAAILADDAQQLYDSRKR